MTKKQVVGWEEELANQAKAQAQIERAPTGRFSFRGGIMQYGEQEIPDNKIDIIVLAYAWERNYYTEAFDPDNMVAPACYSLTIARDPMPPIVPHPDVQVPYHVTCKGCPQDEWGSAPGKSRAKACKERRRLVCVPASVIQDLENVNKSEMAIASIPVMSVKNWSKAVNEAAAMFHRPYDTVIFTMSLKPDAKSQFRVEFQPHTPLPKETVEALRTRTEMAEQMALQPYDQPTEEDAPADSDKY